MVHRTRGRARLRDDGSHLPLRTIAVAILCVLALDARASDDALADAAPDAQATPLPGVIVRADGNDAIESPAFPASTASVNAEQVDATVNAIDVEDAIKYLPSLFVRKRNVGDTQAVLATRTWGVGSSARTLVYVDDVLISALVANNNTIGAPRWGMIVIVARRPGTATMVRSRGNSVTDVAEYAVIHANFRSAAALPHRSADARS